MPPVIWLLGRFLWLLAFPASNTTGFSLKRKSWRRRMADQQQHKNHNKRIKKVVPEHASRALADDKAVCLFAHRPDLCVFPHAQQRANGSFKKSKVNGQGKSRARAGISMPVP
jgi:hypothetical protein